MTLPLFNPDGDPVGEQFFEGQPLVGDVLLVNDTLHIVCSRRWTKEGKLELIVSPDCE